MNKLLFGTAGIPANFQGDTVAGIKEVRRLGLGAMELEFVHSINISKEKAPEVRKASEESNVVLTCHAPYYINLNAIEKPKVHASMNRIISSARIMNLCGGYSVTFHPGFYLKMEKEAVYNNVKKRLREIASKLKEEGIDIWIRPETTGKATQFGDLKELVRLSGEIENVLPCVDFSHLHARSGKNNSYDEFSGILSYIEKSLGKEALENMHTHVSGIEYGEKGERNHVNLKDSDLRFMELIKAFRDFRVKGIVISESPNIQEDALLMKKAYEK
jgi:deoxyribonuclease-4